MLERVRADAGMNIHQFCQRLVDKSKDFRKKVQGEFNGIEIVASPNSCVNDLMTIYSLKHELRHARKNGF